MFLEHVPGLGDGPNPTLHLRRRCPRRDPRGQPGTPRCPRCRSQAGRGTGSSRPRCPATVATAPPSPAKMPLRPRPRGPRARETSRRLGSCVGPGGPTETEPTTSVSDRPQTPVAEQKHALAAVRQVAIKTGPPPSFTSGWLVFRSRDEPGDLHNRPAAAREDSTAPSRSVAWNATVPASFTEPAYVANWLIRSFGVAITVGQSGRSPGMG